MTDALENILISYEQDDFEQRLGNLRLAIMKLARFAAGDERYKQVRQVFHAVAERKDEAVAQFTEKFDGVRLSPSEFRISEQELEKAHKEIDAKLLRTLRKAISNVREYQGEIFIGNYPDLFRHPGIRYTPIRRVGICVPGASAPLPSTVIMTAVPAQVAGVKELVVVSPPRYKGTIHAGILAVCFELGIKEVYRVGGAQAVAALTTGTKNIGQVDKIVGPGNQWVQTAKREAFGLVGIDSIAGPSEVLIIANNKANAAWVAADMLSQAEHDPGSATVFTDSKELAEQVIDELKKAVQLLSRRQAASKCLQAFSIVAVFKGFDDVIRAANGFAPEHLQIHCGDESRRIAEQVENAGAIFIGEYSPAAVGDYWAGPSHTLPTGTSARFFSALSANDFIKSTSIIEYDKAALAGAAEDIIRLAEVEGLDAHAQSIRIRRQGRTK